MISVSPVQDRIRFDEFEADLRTEELFRSGTRIRLPHQSFHLLAILLKNPGQLVTRDELHSSLWPTGTMVEYDQGLNAVVKRLREALGDAADSPRFIQTLPKRGYRFIGTLRPEEAPPQIAAAPAVDPSSAVFESVAAAHGEAAGSAPPEPALVQEPAVASGRPGRRVRLGIAAIVAVIALGAIAWKTVNYQSKVDVQSGWQVVPFTSLPGQEIAPSFSPDGSQIAFAWNGEAETEHQFDLYVKSLGSERLLRLTHHPSLRLTPAWSPDGKSIAFIREEDQLSGLYVIPALGGAERRILANGVAIGSFRQISWSPDSRSLAYSGYASNGAPQVHIVSLDSLETKPLTPAPNCLEAAEPVFSHDGKQLALVCVSSRGLYTVQVLQLPHGPMRPLASLMGEPQGLAWSADGSRLILSNDSGDGGELWELTLEGQLAKLPFGEDSSGPAVSREGRIAYVRGRSIVNIWRVDLSAPQPEESANRLIYSTLAQVVPRYSPDGARIAFQSNRSGSMEIWTTDAEGADPERVTSFNGPMTGAPSWCADNRRIAFDSRASGASAIYVEDVSERVPRKIAASHPNLSSPMWSNDCLWLFAHDGIGRLYRFPAAGGAAERVTDHPSSYSITLPDKLVFNVTQEDGVTLWSKPASGGREERLEKIPKLRYDDSWVANAIGVYFTDASSVPIKVNLYEFATGTTRTVASLKQAPVPGGGPGLGVSPDGRWLLFTQVDDEQSEIMLAQGQTVALGPVRAQQVTAQLDDAE